MTSSAELLTREKLYELVWQEPMLKVAARYGVASIYMARVCVELRVPRPPSGYWSKVEFGKASPAPPLPPARDGDVTEWHPGAVLTAPQRPVAKRTRVKRTASGSPISRAGEPPSQREKVHALLLGAKPHFLKTRKLENGLLRPFKRNLVDIITSEKSLDAALEAANVLFRALTKQGYRVSAGGGYARRPDLDERESPTRQRYHHYLWSPDRATVTTVDDIEFGLTVFETTESIEMVYVGSSKYVPVRDLSASQLARYREPHYWRSHQDIPSGRFGLQAYIRGLRVSWVRRWQETKAGDFPSLVPGIITDLATAVPGLVTKHQEATRKAEEEHLRWEEERRLAEEAAHRARVAKNRQDARSDLLAAIASWEQTRSIHAYFLATERDIEQLPHGQREQLLRRLNEARELVGEVDGLAKLKQWKAPQER